MVPMLSFIARTFRAHAINGTNPAISFTGRT
jgi:hypothetical protein